MATVMEPLVVAIVPLLVSGRPGCHSPCFPAALLVGFPLPESVWASGDVLDEEGVLLFGASSLLHPARSRQQTRNDAVILKLILKDDIA